MWDAIYTVIIGIVLVGALIGWILSLSRKQDRIIKALFTKQAQKRKGTVSHKQYHYSLTFPYLDTPLKLTEYSGSENEAAHSTITCVLFHPIQGTIKIHSRTYLYKISEKIGMRIFKTGDSEFDEQYFITSSDVLLVNTFLDAQIRAKLLSNRHCKPFISIKETLLTVRFPKFLLTEPEQDELIDLAQTLLRKFNG